MILCRSDQFVAQGGEVPYTEMFGTFALSVGAAVSLLINHLEIQIQIFFFSYLCTDEIMCLSLKLQVGMEFWARWAHKALWHASLWHMHEVGLVEKQISPNNTILH